MGHGSYISLRGVVCWEMNKAIVLFFLLSGSASAIPIPDWMLHEAYAISEMAQKEARIDCVQFNHWTRRVGTCITMMEWCRIHRIMGEPVDNLIACRPPDMLFGLFR